MPDDDVPPEALIVIELIAGAVRDELGDEIDAYPGHSAPEQADPLNRAFQAVVLTLLESGPTPGVPVAVSVSGPCAGSPRRRLAADGCDALQARLLLDEEPGSPDDWLTFLVLSSRTQVEPRSETSRPTSPDAPFASVPRLPVCSHPL